MIMIVLGILFLAVALTSIKKKGGAGPISAMQLVFGVVFMLGGAFELLDPREPDSDRVTHGATVAEAVKQADAAVHIPPYSDPKGHFRIAPPAGWRLQAYPDDPRGKVAFTAPDGRSDLRVLVKAVDIADMESLLSNLRQIEQQLGVSTHIEPLVFNGLPAFKRTAVVQIQGVTHRFLMVDLLIDGYSHSLQYGSSPEQFDQHYAAAWKNMLTYTPLRRAQAGTPEEAQRHEAAKWLRLARIALDMNNRSAAVEAVAAGLAADSGNAELQKLQKELGAGK
jgi:hypothetical protein